jgi:hypothetical protein
VSDLLQNRSLDELSKAFPELTMQTFKEAFVQEQMAAQTRQEKIDSLSGFNFGTGIGANFDLHSGSRVKDASIRDGVVRVDEESDARLGLVLETHYFWTPWSLFTGIGPFVAVRTGENDDLIDEAGLGVMIGFRRKETDTNSFNIGLGFMIDPNAEVLGDGFSPNVAPPPGATDVALKKEERTSFAVIFSYTF